MIVLLISITAVSAAIIAALFTLALIYAFRQLSLSILEFAVGDMTIIGKVALNFAHIILLKRAIVIVGATNRIYHSSQ